MKPQPDDAIVVSINLTRYEARMLARFLNDDRGLRNAAADHLLKQRRASPRARSSAVVRALGRLSAALSRVA